MREQLERDAEGYVSLSLICSFNRVKKMNLSADEVASILASSKLLQVDSKGQRVRGRPDAHPTERQAASPALDEVKRQLVARVSALG
mmetsp:Transcript_1041/g.2129  ORF Transcript_1041/g.2129 Transcript_1041/m.2129 type:complete len:87 (+) Transcript_1041:417-677(+)